MALRRSVGLDALLLTELVSAIHMSSIHVFSGPQPAGTTSAATGTLLYSITNGVSGLTWVVDPVLGVASKDPGQVWSGEAIATGTAGWFRICIGDPVSPVPGGICIDGSLGTKNADIVLRSLHVEQGTLQVISHFDVLVL